MIMLCEDEMQKLKKSLDLLRMQSLAAHKVIVNDHTTIVVWNDGTKTKSTCAKEDEFNLYSGIMACFLKKIMGTKLFHAKVDRAVKKAQIVQAPKSKSTSKKKK